MRDRRFEGEFKKVKSDRRSFIKWTGVGAAVSAAGVASPAYSQPIAQKNSSGSPNHVWNVRTFGAVGDGKTLDTQSINRAIEKAAAAGGGSVVFPAGTYLSYSIHLKSNVELYLASGATILAAPSPANGPSTSAYDIAGPAQPSDVYEDYGHSHWHDSMLWGEDLHDVSICGPGLIWGDGLVRGWDSERPLAQTPGVGSKAIALKNCRNVILRDFAILKGGWFGILATGVDNLTIDNLRIDTNRDGMDIDCCRNVRISNCSVNSPWDDAISPKSSFALGYARATENLTISNCYVTGAYELGTMLDGTWKRRPVDKWRFGGIKFGTETNGGFRNIAVTGCIFDNCQGIGLYSVDGAVVEDIVFADITMRACSNVPLSFRLGSRMRSPAQTPVGSFKRIIVSNLISHDSASEFGGAGIIAGIQDHLISDIKVNNCYFEHRGGTSAVAALLPAEDEHKYPEPGMFGPIPASGFFIRNARNIEFVNVEIASIMKDARPDVWLSNIDGADFFRLKTPRSRQAPVFDLHSVKNFQTISCTNVKDMTMDSIVQKQI
jgi:polygalacturonase